MDMVETINNIFIIIIIIYLLKEDTIKRARITV